MELFIWNETLSVGVKEIDKDHQHLVGLLNALIQSINDEKGNTEIAGVLEELLDYTSWHFRHEERLMQTYSYEGFPKHKNEHVNLIDQAVALQEAFVTKGEGITPVVLEFLKSWLTNHILGTDMKMGQFLQNEM